MRLLPACGALLLGVVAVAESAAPPVPGPIPLTAEQRRELDRWSRQIVRAEAAGTFEKAEQAARQIVALRQRWHGAKYWETVNAGRAVEEWARRTRVAVPDRPDLVRALVLLREAYGLTARRRFPEAEGKARAALPLLRGSVGENHPDTALGYYLVASSLSEQGRHADALPFYEQSLAVRRKALGEKHRATATSSSNVAVCLIALGRHAEALPLLRRALDIHRELLGEGHPNTATCSSNLAGLLRRLGRHTEAVPLFERALDVRRWALGEKRPATVQSYHELAQCLVALDRHADALPYFQRVLEVRRQELGEGHLATAASSSHVALCLIARERHADALPLLRRALDVRRKQLGEEHPQTATSYLELAVCLSGLGRHVDALPQFNRAVEIRRQVLGEGHPHVAEAYTSLAFSLGYQGRHADALALHRRALLTFRAALGEKDRLTAVGYSGLAGCLDAQGKHAEALPLFRTALAITREVLGEDHPQTVLYHLHLANCLLRQGKHAEALPLFRSALDTSRKVRGEKHRTTAQSLNGLAFCLNAQGKHAEALLLFRRALAVTRKVLGEAHPVTALAYNNVAFCLDGQGKPADALPLHRRALKIFRKTRGEEHPDTAASYHNVAFCLCGLGRHNEAALHWQAGLVGFESGRLAASDTGFDRALFRSSSLSPRAALAICLVRLGHPVRAWDNAENDLARGLLDDLAGDAARRARERVLPLAAVQKQIPADAAIVFWLDGLGQHLGCVLRRAGPPVWVRLPGSGKADAWTRADDTLAERTLAALATPAGVPLRQRLAKALHHQRLAPLEPQLKGVRRLLVVPSGPMAAVPVEALTDRYTVAYVPSATVFARLSERAAAPRGGGLLVLGDPMFDRAAAKRPEPPAFGLFVRAVVPGGAAARSGILPADVLLAYAGKALRQPADLREEPGDRVVLRLWREGRTRSVRVPGGKLGVVIDRRRPAEAVAAWRRQEAELLALSRGKDPAPLPGTRLEALSLAALVPNATTLLGSAASAESLARLAAADKLKAFRLLHLATHGEANTARPGETALLLARDQLPVHSTAEVDAVLADRKPPDGRLTVRTVLREWRLDADLVVLSACETGLGQQAGGEGLLGFSQALLQKGARAVVLSRWKVDDAATTLLMVRFYENLLGKRQGLKAPLGKAEALAEAKRWLRELPRTEATARLAALADGVPRGTPRPGLPLLKPDAAKDDRPFAAPYYWAAFVLIGDPR